MKKDNKNNSWDITIKNGNLSFPKETNIRDGEILLVNKDDYFLIVDFESFVKKVREIKNEIEIRRKNKDRNYIILREVLKQYFRIIEVQLEVKGGKTHIPKCVQERTNIDGEFILNISNNYVRLRKK